MKRAMLTLVLCACMHGAPPPQLQQARQDYQAAKVVGAPRDVAAAGAALAAANREFEERGDNIRVRDLAYVASRKADIARANARAYAERQKVAQLSIEAEVLKQQQRAVAAVDVAPPPPPPPPNAVAVNGDGPAPAGVASTAEAATAPTPPKVEVATAPPPVDGTQTTSAPVAVHGRAQRPMRPSVPFTPPKLSFAEVKADDSRGTVITVPAALLYEPASEALSPTAKARLDQIAESLEDNERRVTIEVHGDNGAGTDELCEKRAKAARDALIERGIAAELIEAVGRGDDAPLVSNETAENRAKNRRVDFVIR